MVGDPPPRFSLFVSPLVLEESARGDADYAAKRLLELAGIPVLELTAEARDLARSFVSTGIITPSAAEDALHVAIATMQGMDYLPTWNCRHIANAEIIRRLAALCDGHGYSLPSICTPEQLMGE